MIFQVENFYVDLASRNDLKEIFQVYNSNTKFLLNHMGKDKVTYDWISEELESMIKVGFYSCKIVDKNLGKIIGIIDFKIGEETYLSLLMLHSDYRNRGLGGVIYNAFEEYVKSCKSKYVRIDVVTDYDSTVLDFWLENGFSKFKDIKLNWTGKVLPAIIMKKKL